MIKLLKYILVFFSLLAGFNVQAQSNLSSPYSKFGLGIPTGSLLPQGRSIGGLTAGLRTQGTYYNVNIANPASYSALRYTTLDIGIATDFNMLAKDSRSQSNFNASLGHIVFGIPVTTQSAFSFGIIPYTRMGYRFKNRTKLENIDVDYIYDGDGGVSKVFLGYGFQIGKHISLGANVNYLFGKISRNSSAEFPTDPSALSSKMESSKSVSGFSYDYGIQYMANPSTTTRLTIGYSGAMKNKINTRNSVLMTRYKTEISGDASLALDTILYQERVKEQITLPNHHAVGFTVEKINQWMLGAEFSYDGWSAYREAGMPLSELKNSYGVRIGTQFTPDISSVSNYFKVIDYRLGLRYDKTYLQINNNDIKQYSLTLGMGFPLPSLRSTTFYKINLTTELGQRGTKESNLVQERFVNIHIGFTLNDKWFNKYKFD